MSSITTTTITITITTTSIIIIIIIIISITTTTTTNSSSSKNSRAWSVVMRPIDYDACFWLAASSTLSTLMGIFSTTTNKFSSFIYQFALIDHCSVLCRRIVGFSVGECWFLDEQTDHQHLLLKQSSSLCNAMQMCNMNVYLAKQRIVGLMKKRIVVLIVIVVLIIVTFDLCQSCSSQAHYPAASFDLCIC
ncbi:hypothetical protein T11_7269 [Trichinella zimbabwensis]|uniref:Uncharacterized protein n=1 Tax=Trichinella zimbabwensis TaxID=268475 RepID=A0A0V1H2U4_9BILA|nr:hypothetical protein T11_7269 [Trichinella zimbabwensis]